jgi:hypothetical protein
MAEMIVPGTYIDVRAEGLISAGRVATGIVGIVGTAARGAIGEPITLASYSNARDLFGLPDNYTRPEDGSHPLTLVRALEHIYNNGASTVVAVRVAGSSKANATYAVQNGSDQTVATLTAKTPGSWGNSISIEVKSSEDECRVDSETHKDDATFAALNYAGVVPSAENRIRLFRGTTRRNETLNLIYKRTIKDEEVVRRTQKPFYKLAQVPVEKVNAVNVIRVQKADGTEQSFGTGSILYDSGNLPAVGEVNINTTTGELTFFADPTAEDRVIATYAAGQDAPKPGDILVTTWDGKLDFATGEAPSKLNGDRLVASYLVDRANCVLVTLTHEAVREAYIAPDGRLLVEMVNKASKLVTAAPDDTHGIDKPKTGINNYFGTGSNDPGNNGADASKDDYTAGLERIANMLINIVVLAGQNVEKMGTVLEGHLNATAQVDLERIGVIGAPGTTLAEALGHTVASDRMIVVAPGMVYPDPDRTRLPAAYTAAAVAGLISSLAVQISLTNKPLAIPRLDIDLNRGEQEQAIKRNLLTVVNNSGYRVLKGITTQGEGQPFAAVPTRRIVDYAKYGVRSAANPYLGRLNNSRVRAALQATLEAFLTRMVEDEALTGFDLEVSATRAQEIAGEVAVVMTLQPTFSIDFIKVTMNLH